MKKIKLKITKKKIKKRKIKSKVKNQKVKLNNNPRNSRPTWIDKDYSEVKNHLDWLINQNVILKIHSGISQSSNGLAHIVYRNIYGILKKKFIYSFQFNPLNQWKYKKHEKEKQEQIQPIKRTNKDPEFIDYGNEFDQHLIIESEFENDEPTFEFQFAVTDVDSIENDNEIYLLSSREFEPREIK